ncbi:MAG: deoxyguanosinetriphosphate triphosphohydrolase family protein [Candidatus Obscuribacterales bacterium]
MTQFFYPLPRKVLKPEVEKILLAHRRTVEEREGAALFEKAAFSSGHSRYFGPEQDHRLPYRRDVDRIIHSRAYARYADKTQVVHLSENDHVTQRALHVQLVSNFARGIAEILRLNCDLVEAIALGHDVGHPPFGHEGERCLSELSLEYRSKAFAHPVQSCRLFREIEPLNLGLAVADGFLCHDGGMIGTSYAPQWGKTWDDHFAELAQKEQDPGVSLMPTTLEGCLVKLADTVSYLGRDIEDAVRLDIVRRNEIPATSLGRENREMLGILAADIIGNSFEQEAISISEEVFEALKTIRQFNFERIYSHPKLKIESVKVQRGYRVMFEALHEDYLRKEESSLLWRDFLHNKPERYVEAGDLADWVCDYISGMTDRYFIKGLERLILPCKVEWP